MAAQNLHYASVSRNQCVWTCNDSWEPTYFSYFFTEINQQLNRLFGHMPHRRVVKNARKSLPMGFFVQTKVGLAQPCGWALVMGHVESFVRYHVAIGNSLGQLEEEQLALLAASLFCYSQADVIYFYAHRSEEVELFAKIAHLAKEPYLVIDEGLAENGKQLTEQVRFSLDTESWEGWPLAQQIIEDLAYLSRAKANIMRRQKKRLFGKSLF